MSCHDGEDASDTVIKEDYQQAFVTTSSSPSSSQHNDHSYYFQFNSGQAEHNSGSSVNEPPVEEEKALMPADTDEPLYTTLPRQQPPTQQTFQFTNKLIQLQQHHLNQTSGQPEMGSEMRLESWADHLSKALDLFNRELSANEKILFDFRKKNATESMKLIYKDAVDDMVFLQNKSFELEHVYQKMMSKRNLRAKLDALRADSNKMGNSASPVADFLNAETNSTDGQAEAIVSTPDINLEIYQSDDFCAPSPPPPPELFYKSCKSEDGAMDNFDELPSYVESGYDSNTYYKCKFKGCGRVFSRLSDIREHIHKVGVHQQLYNNSEGAFKCPHCDKRFLSLASLYGHQSVHSAKRSATSHQPGSEKMDDDDQMDTEEQMEESASLVQTKSTTYYRCNWPGCSNIFHTKDSLSKHRKRIHIERRYQTGGQYKCKQCSASFKTQLGLMGHRNVHVSTQLIKTALQLSSNSRNEKGSVKTPSKFHRYYHSCRGKDGNTYYRCKYPECKRLFSNSDTAVRHYKQHLIEKTPQNGEFKCKFCVSTFNTRQALNGHQKAHLKSQVINEILDSDSNVDDLANNDDEQLESDVYYMNEDDSVLQPGIMYSIEDNENEETTDENEQSTRMSHEQDDDDDDDEDDGEDVDDDIDPSQFVSQNLIETMYPSDEKMMPNVVKYMEDGIEKKYYTCSYPLCQRRFYLMKSWTKHRKRHENSEFMISSFPCNWPGCGTEFSSAVDLSRHKSVHSGSVIRCDVAGCSKVVKSLRLLSHHKRNAHKKRSLLEDSDDGSHIFYQMGDLTSNDEDHDNEMAADEDTDGPSYELIAPGTVSRQSHKLQPNLVKRVENGVEKLCYSCSFPSCSRVFYTQRSWRRHRLRHERSDGLMTSFVCNWPDCGQQFSSPVDLSEHKETHMGKTITCDFKGCDKVCVNIRALLSHKNRYHNVIDSNFTCEFPGCGKSFEREMSLKVHQRLHSPKLQNVNLLTNLLTNSWRCKLCFKRFSTENSLDIHMKSHSAEFSLSQDESQEGSAATSEVSSTSAVKTETPSKRQPAGPRLVVCTICGSSKMTTKPSQHYGATTCTCCFDYFRKYLKKPRSLTCRGDGQCVSEDGYISKYGCKSCFTKKCWMVYQVDEKKKAAIISKYPLIVKSNPKIKDEAIDLNIDESAMGHEYGTSEQFDISFERMEDDDDDDEDDESMSKSVNC